MKTQALRTYLDQFKPLKPEEWQFLSNGLSGRTVERKGLISDKGAIENNLYLIVKSCARAYYKIEEREYTISIRFENEFMNSYVSFLTQRPSRVYVQAIEHCELITLPRQLIYDFYERFSIGNFIGRKITETLMIEKFIRESLLVIREADERFKFLLQDNRLHWLQRVPKKYLASYLNRAPETFSRIRQQYLDPNNVRFIDYNQ